MKKVYLEYVDGDRIVKGIFELVEQTSNYVKVKSGKNIITIPYHKLNKIKEKKENE